MTDFRNPGVLLVSEARYRAINRFNGIFSIVVSALLFVGTAVFGLIGPPFAALAASVALLGIAALGIGVLTVMIVAKFPFVEHFARAVSISRLLVLGVGVVAAVLSLLLSRDIGVGLLGALLAAFLTGIISMTAWGNRNLVRTGVALIAPPTT